MAMGSLTLACALLLLQAGPQDPSYMPEGNFKIPISVLPEKRSSIRELHLYVSRDKGQTWTRESIATPDKDSFPFYAANDGEYWFNIAIIYRDGRQDPVDIYQSPVGLRVIVDTRKPDIRTGRAERRGDEVLVAWDIREDNPDLASFRLEYRNADGSGLPWTPISVTPALQGETSFRVATTGAVQLRICMDDLAKNKGQATTEVAALAGASLPSIEPVSAGPGAIAPPPGVNANPVPMSGQSYGSQVPDYRQPTLNEPVPNQYSRPQEPSPLNRQAPSPPPVPSPPAMVTQPPVARSEPNGFGIMQTSGPGERPSSAATTYASGLRGGLPGVDVVNKDQVRVNFQVGKYGPSGLGSVDVYMTTDDGATWTLSPGDHSVTLPSPIEMRGGGTAAVSMTVDLKEEGVVYGFYVVVKSRAGLGIRPPEPGTPPQIRVEKDATAPVVALYVPQPDPGHRDALLLTWKATDAHLATNPVTLEWAERVDGQWNLIGSPELPNSGQFSWQVPADIPPTVYLRVSVRDTAGNRAVAQTREPVVVDLSVPEPAGFKISK